MNQNKNNMLKESFNRFLKEHVTPLLKKNGFIKKGNKYIFLREQINFTIHVQLSRWNTSNDISFTFNWGIEFPNQFNSWLIDKRLPVLYKGHDQWWEITEKKPSLTEEEITDIHSILLNGAIKFFNYMSSAKDVIDFLNHVERKERYKEFYTNVLIPQIDILKTKLALIR